MDKVANVIQRIDNAPDRDRPLPAAVSAHFSKADNDLPDFDASQPHGTLVRFRAMIQDTSLQNELYLARFSDGRCGGWGIEPSGDVTSDPDCLGTASVFWAVSVPGERADRCYSTHHSTQPHKFPIPGAPHIGARIKIYDSTDVDKLRSTDIVTFVGVTSSEFLSVEDDSSLEVPVLHVLSYKVDFSNPMPTKFDPSVRTDLVNWISSEALGADIDAAEWILLQLVSKTHSRAIQLLPPSLTLSCFPQPCFPELLPTLSHILADLLPQYLPIPLSLDLLNNIPFLPESKEEDLHSGYLQLPRGTSILLTENAIQEGKLLENGIMNIRAIQDVMDSQTIDYIFPFSSRFTFNTDLSMIVVTPGRKSALFQTSINIPLRCPPATPGLYKPKDEISSPSAEKLAVYRSYIAACKDLSGKVQVSEETSKYIQDDFVRLRHQDKSVTSEELIHLMKVARLLTASRLQNEVTTDTWEQAKEFDSLRQVRQCSVGNNVYGS